MSNQLVKTSDARTRIIETADRLFYAEGIRGVGIDRIIREADVAKMSLYKHFASKDDLILAVLKQREERVFAMFERAMARHVRSGKDGVGAFFGALKEWFESEGFRGCSFINARVELADAAHEASKFSASHKERFYGLLKGIIAKSAGARVADAVVRPVSLLVEGAIVTAVMEQSSEAADAARDAAMALLVRAQKR